MEIYKVIKKDDNVLSFTSTKEIKDWFEITDEEWETQTFRKIKEIKVYDEKGRYIGTQKELKNLGNRFKKLISQIKPRMEVINHLKDTLNNVYDTINKQIYIINILYPLHKFSNEYNQLKSDGKVKGIGIKLPYKYNNSWCDYTFDGDCYKVDYCIKALNKFGFNICETPHKLFIDYNGYPTQTTYDGDINDIYWIGIDIDIHPNKYGFDIHNHTNPSTYNSNKEINMGWKLFEDIKTNDFKAYKLHTHPNRYPMGTMVLFLYLLVDELTKEEMKYLMLSDKSYYLSLDLGKNKEMWMERLQLDKYDLLLEKLLRNEDEFTLTQIKQMDCFKWINEDEELYTVKNFKIKRKIRYYKPNEVIKTIDDGTLIGETINQYGDTVKQMLNYMEWEF